MSVSRHVSVFVGGLALAVALLFAPDEARAQRDACGALASGVATCADAAYASGIRYDAADGWGNGIAGDIGLTVTGGSATAITSATATGWGSGIVLRTAEHATATRTIALSVGVDANAGNAVTIAQSSASITGGFDDTGVVLHQRGTGASPTTVTLGSGVAIGTMTTPMQRSGVHVLVESTANTADHAITSAADIHSSAYGIVLDSRGSGSTAITNSGAIVNMATTGGVTGQADGIRILDWSGTGGNERPATATTTVTNEAAGSISVNQAGGSGIRVDAEGLGLYKTVNSGTVSAAATAAHGIFVEARRHWGAAGTEAVEIENSGTITTASTGGIGIYVETVANDALQGRGDGNVEVTNSGTVSSSLVAVLVNSNMGDTTIKHTGGSITSTAVTGIQVQQGGTGAVTIESGADVTAEQYGIRVLNSPTPAATTVTVAVAAGVTTRTNEPVVTIASGTTTTTYATLGDVSVTHSGGDIEAETESGISVQQAGADATVASSADITARKYGILVTNNPALATMAIAAGVTTNTWSNTGAVSVTHSGGDVAAKTESGIHAQNSAGNADAVTVAVTGGSVKTEGQSKAAVSVLQFGTGDAVASVSSGATLTSKHNAGIYADFGHNDNTAGQVKVTQGGTIAARKGVYARVGRVSPFTVAAGVTTDETRAATAQPAIDVTWTGGFSHGTSVTVAQNDDDRFLANGVAHAIAVAQEVETEKALRGDPMNTGFLRYGSPAGIEAQVMSWRAVMTAVAKGDDPGAFADAAAVTALFADDADAATKARAAAIIAAFRTALTNADLDDVPGAAAIDGGQGDGTAADGTYHDDEIQAYLSEDDDARRALLRNVLAQSFTDAEKAVLRAVATNEGLTDAVLDAALPAGATDEQKTAYRTAVRALLDRRNVGDVRVRMNGGSIAATRGDGIRAYYATPNAMNGAIEVTVAAGATVSGGMAGIYVANAGMADDIRRQTVTVNGQVTGGTDAAVHLVGGGKLTVGETGRVLAGSSGRAILVNEAGRSEIVINGLVRGGTGGDAAVRMSGGGTVTIGVNGRVEAGGATNAIQADMGDALVTLRVEVDDDPSRAPYRDEGDPAEARVDGKIVGAVDDDVVILSVDPRGRTGLTTTVSLAANGTLDLSGFDERPKPRMDCSEASDDRCRLYEALPSALLSMNGLPTYRERMSSARSANGGWARLEAASGKWKARRSTQDDVAYDGRRTGLRAGVDMAVGEEGLVGLSAHGVTGSAKMTGNGGKVAMTGIGLGLNATAQTVDGIHLDAQLAVTRYRAKLTDGDGAMLKDGARGTGYALALEAGRSISAGGDMSVTPRAGLAWSSVSLRGFTDTRGSGTPVSMKNAGSFTGGVGVDVETAPAAGGPVLFGSLDVAHRFSKTTETRVAGTVLEATAAPTSARLGLGFAQGWEGGRHALQGSVSYTTAGGGNSEFGGALSFTTRF